MSTGKTLRRILFAAIWLGIGAGMLTLLLAAIGQQNKQVCKDYIINIKSVQNNFFIDKKDVSRMVSKAKKGGIKGEPVASFNLMVIENLLEKNEWIRDAELYFDGRDVLHITVTEREPVARIFTREGKSFYIDSSANKMGLSDNMSAGVPVFTNFPDRKKLNSKDSVLLNDIKRISLFIMNNPFWMAQVSQVDIVESCGQGCWQFEMVPTVGDHLVRLGDGENIHRKFGRLFMFYNQVMSKSGFNRYSIVDVQYAGQVIGTQKGTAVAKRDTARLRNELMALQLQQGEQLEKNIVSADLPVKTVAKTEPAKLSNPNPQKTNPKKKSEERNPKAVMREKRNKK
jgi:cell division protein FtsQ